MCMVFPIKDISGFVPSLTIWMYYTIQRIILESKCGPCIWIIHTLWWLFYACLCEYGGLGSCTGYLWSVCVSSAWDGYRLPPGGPAKFNWPQRHVHIWYTWYITVYVQTTDQTWFTLTVQVPSVEPIIPWTPFTTQMYV